MSRHRHRHRHRRPRRPLLPLVRALLAVTVLVAGAVALTSSTAPQATGAEAGPSVAPLVAERGTTGGTAPPVRVRVPAIAVDSTLVRLGTDAAGALAPPTDFATAGWFAGGATPGDVGPAVLAGHVDSASGPAVFFRLGELTPGDAVLVDRADGTTARFTVSAVGRYPKTEFPTAAVYGPTPRAELRLVTCGGDFDRARRSYTDNVVVTAVLTP